MKKIIDVQGRLATRTQIGSQATRRRRRWTITVLALALTTRFATMAYAGSTFQGSTFQGSTFQGSTFQGSTFQGSTFQGSTFQGSTFQGSTFQGSHLRAAHPADAGPIEAGPDGPGDASGRLRRIEVSHFAGDTVHATVWDAADAEGRRMRLHPRDLVGLRWTEEACDAERCEAVTYRVAAAARDTSSNTMPQHGDNSDVWLHRVEYAPASAPDRWRNVCGEDTPDVPMGIFVDGRWAEDGTWHPGGWTYSCPSGVISKCVRSWGYKPWKTLPSPECGEVRLQPLHQACTRAARADYCGDGISHTRDGTLVDMFDTCGLNVREDLPGFHEESAFDQGGALWVSIPRWPTGTRTDTGWRFATCERPREAPHLRASARIHVWSDPTKGRAAAGE